MLWLIALSLADTGTEGVQAEAGLDFMAYLGQTVELSGDGAGTGDVQFSWVRTSGPPVELSDPGAPNPRFTPAQAGTYTFSLTVSDDVASDTDSVTVAVVHTDAGTVHAPVGCTHAPAAGGLLGLLALLGLRRRT